MFTPPPSAEGTPDGSSALESTDAKSVHSPLSRPLVLAGPRWYSLVYEPDWGEEGGRGGEGTRSYGFDARTIYNAQGEDSDWQDYSAGVQPPVESQANEA